MIEVDLHSHSLFSGCGVHTIIELLEYGKKIGMKALAITDHGRAVGGKINSVYWNRLKEPVDGIKFLKGIECNVVDESGKIDFPKDFIQYADIILLGLHNNLKEGLGQKRYTEMLITAMEKNPYVDIITHPTDQVFKIEFLPVIQTAKKLGIALEFNNSKLLYNKVSPEISKEFLKLCIEHKASIVLCSDAHTVNELGRDDLLRPILKEINFPQDLIINSTPEKAYEFIEKRRRLKIEFLGSEPN